MTDQHELARTDTEVEPFPDPGLPEHLPRPTDVDERLERRAECQVAGLFGLSTLFMVLFVVLFTASGIGNGSTFRTIGVIFDRQQAGPVLGWTSAVAAYGAFVAPVVIGAQIWRREHVIPMLTGHDGQRDRVYLVRMPRFDPVPLIGWEALRDEFVHDIRWWSVDEIDAATNSKVLFMPRRLAHFAREVLEHGPPAEPVDTGM